jgi:hypothetical protein
MAVPSLETVIMIHKDITNALPAIIAHGLWVAEKMGLIHCPDL